MMGFDIPLLRYCVNCGIHLTVTKKVNVMLNEHIIMSRI